MLRCQWLLCAAPAGLIVLGIAAYANAIPVTTDTQTPVIESQQEPNHSIEGAGQSERQKQQTNASTPRFDSNTSRGESKTAENAKHGGEEATEYWPPFLGYKFKVTDSLLALFTFGLVVVGLLQVYWIKETVDKSNDALIKTQRAFVFVKEFQFHWRIGAALQNVLSLGVIPVWENSGNTPTKNTFTRVSWEAFDTVLPDDFNFPDRGDPENSRTLIGPKAIIWGDILEINLATLVASFRGERFIYIWGWIDYDDVFEGTQRHRTEFCSQLSIIGDPQRQDTARVVPRQYKKFNGHDAECLHHPAPVPPN